VKRAVLAALLLLGSVASAQQEKGLNNLANGFAVDKAYHLNDLDQISTFNGNLSINIPLGVRYPVSSGLSYQFVLNYGGNTWDYVGEYDYWTGIAGDDPTATYGVHEILVSHAEARAPSAGGVGHPGNAGMGWHLSLGSMETENVYVSPDGGRHEFYPFLHDSGAEDGTTGARYTRDGTYLRRKIVDGLIQIEFPDGSRHRFEPTGRRRLVAMLDSFGKQVTITYGRPVNCAPNDCVDDWTITDGPRVHTVDMRLLHGSLEGTSQSYEVVRKLVLQTAEGPAAYTFAYEGADSLVGISRRLADWQDCRYHPVVLVPLLASVTLPDGSKFEMTTDRGDAVADAVKGWKGKFSSPDGTGGGLASQECASPIEIATGFSGNIRALTRPTGATTTWDWQFYKFPELFYPVTEDCRDGVRCPKNHRTKRDAVGVKERVDTARGETVLTRKTYAHALAGETVTSTVSTYEPKPDGTFESVLIAENHYRVPSTVGSLDSEYGLPFTRNVSIGASDGGVLFLSTRLKSGDGAKLRETYVKYVDEMPSRIQDDPSSANRRVIEERVVDYGAGGAVTNDVITTSSDFDGLGHHRVVAVATASGIVPAVTRTVTTRYNQKDGDTDPDADYEGTQNGTFVEFDTDRNWVLNTYSSQTTTDGVSSLKTLFDFDRTTGFLERRRTLSAVGTSTAPTPSTNDVVGLFGHDAAGNVTSEKYYGRDDQEGESTTAHHLSTSEPLHTLALPAAPLTSLTHSYSSGVLATSKYSSLSYNFVNRTIDSKTGATLTSTDPAGVVTSFGYDWAGRLLLSAPTGGSATSFAFTPAKVVDEVFTNASVSVEQHDGDESKAVDVAAAVEYDQLGRVSRETRTMPDGTDSHRVTTYNGRGLVATVSEWGAVTKKTSFTYDSLGRVLTTTAPDTSVVELAYDGRSTARTTKVAACANTSSSTCDLTTASWSSGTAATTTETADSFGRLYQVVEPGGTTTTYGYDLGDRLVAVNMAGQARSFLYDGRGFLTAETHPESQTTEYTYDARGHVLSRTAAAGTSSAATVTFAYDAAERVLNVSDSTGILKVFTYDRSTSDKSRGKLATATRYNRGVAGSDVTVTETYHYAGDAAGRLSSKLTGFNLGGTRTFTDTYGYTPLGGLDSVTYPQCAGCGDLQQPSRTVTSRYTAGFLTGVDGYTAAGQALAYWPNGMLKQVSHADADGTQGPIDKHEISSTNGMARPLSITFSDFCTDLSVQELGSKSVTSGQSASLTVSAPGATSYQWYEVAADGTDQLLAGQTTNVVTVTVSSTRRFWVRAGNGSCTVDSNVATVTPTTCPLPNTTITMASTLIRNQSATASVAQPTGGATYVWTVTGGTITSGGTASSVTFTVACDAALVTAKVVVTPSCSSTSATGSKNANTSAASSIALSSDRSTIPQGASETITVDLTGTPPWKVTWSDGAPEWNGSATSFQRIVTPPGTITYTATATDKNLCPASDALPLTVTPPAPANLVAAAISGTQVRLDWTPAGFADSFEIERRAPGGAFVSHGSAAASPATLAAAANTAYLYRVRAVKAGTRSGWSNVDLATTVVFGADVVPRETVLTASHIAQLRTAVNAVRALWNSALAPAAFTDPTLEGVVAKAIHITELRNVLNDARAGLPLPAWAYSTPAPTAGQPFAAAHVNDLRGGVR
jgi:YD repeat-containing protein